MGAPKQVILPLDVSAWQAALPAVPPLDPTLHLVIPPIQFERPKTDPDAFVPFTYSGDSDRFRTPPLDKRLNDLQNDTSEQLNGTVKDLFNGTNEKSAIEMLGNLVGYFGVGIVRHAMHGNKRNRDR